MSNGNSEQAPGLFGWVPEGPRSPGRPAFQWTRENSNKIMVLFAQGRTRREVARILRIDVKTLRKVFPRECQHADDAALLIRSGMMAQLVTLAENGSVGAMRQLDKMLSSRPDRAPGKRPDRAAA